MNSLQQIPVEKSNHTTRLIVVTLLLFLAGILLCGCMLHAETVLWVPMVFLLFVITAIIVCGFGGKLHFSSIIALLIALVTAFSRVLDTRTGFYITVVVLLCYGFLIYSMFREKCKPNLGVRFVLTLTESAFIAPFVSIPSYFRALLKGDKAEKAAALKKLGMLAICIIGSFLLCLIVIGLLSFDDTFAGYFEIMDGSVWLYILQVIFSLHFTLFTLSAIFSGMNKVNGRIATDERAETITRKMRFLPYVLLCVPAAALMIIYGLFFVSQLDYYVGAFRGYLPPHLSASEYAREGFFQLFAVTVINALLLVGLSAFAKTVSKTGERIVRSVSFLLSAVTVVLALTALSKMFLYIRRFDLTTARLNVTLLMVLITLVMLLHMAAQVFKRMRMLPVLTVVMLGVILLLPLYQPKTIVAEYNVSSYINARKSDQILVRDIDLRYLDYGAPSTPALVRLYDSGVLKKQDQESLYRLLSDELMIYEDTKEDNDRNRPRYFSIEHHRSSKALERFHLLSVRDKHIYEE